MGHVSRSVSAVFWLSPYEGSKVASSLALLQVLASEAQETLEAAIRLLLVTQDTSEGAAAGLKPRIAAASKVGAALRSSQEALARALKTPTLTSGKSKAALLTRLNLLSH